MNPEESPNRRSARLQGLAAPPGQIDPPTRANRTAPTIAGNRAYQEIDPQGHQRTPASYSRNPSPGAYPPTNPLSNQIPLPQRNYNVNRYEQGSTTHQTPPQNFISVPHRNTMSPYEESIAPEDSASQNTSARMTQSTTNTKPSYFQDLTDYEQQNSEQVDQTRLTQHMKRFLRRCYLRKFKDQELWTAFKEYYRNFTEEAFKKVDYFVKRDLRSYLRSNGVYINLDETDIAKEFHRILNEVAQQSWSESEVHRQQQIITEQQVRTNQAMRDADKAIDKAKQEAQISRYLTPVQADTSPGRQLHQENIQQHLQNVRFEQPFVQGDRQPLIGIGSIPKTQRFTNFDQLANNTSTTPPIAEESPSRKGKEKEGDKPTSYVTSLTNRFNGVKAFVSNFQTPRQDHTKPILKTATPRQKQDTTAQDYQRQQEQERYQYQQEQERYQRQQEQEQEVERKNIPTVNTQPTPVTIEHRGTDPNIRNPNNSVPRFELNPNGYYRYHNPNPQQYGYQPYPLPLPIGNGTGYADPPPAPTKHPTDDSKTKASVIQGFYKMFNDSDKFNGTPKQNFEAKLRLFKSNANAAQLKPEDYNTVFPTMFTGSARDYILEHIHCDDTLTFEQKLERVRAKYDNPQQRQEKLNHFNKLSLKSVIEQNPDKSLIECYDILTEDLRHTQQGLNSTYRNEQTIRDRLEQAVDGHPAVVLGLTLPTTTFEDLNTMIRTSISKHTAVHGNHPTYTTSPDANGHYTDRRLGPFNDRRSGNNRFGKYNKYGNKGAPYKGPNFKGQRPYKNPYDPNKRCWICRQPGCWSTKHSKQERDHHFEQLRQNLKTRNYPYNNQYLEQFIVGIEGREDEEEEEEEEESDSSTNQDLDNFIQENAFNIDTYGPAEQNFAAGYYNESYLTYSQDPDAPSQQALLDLDEPTNESETYITGIGGLNGKEVVRYLQENSTRHALTKQTSIDILQLEQEPKTKTYTFVNNRYSQHTFHGILVDTGASFLSTGGIGQATALIEQHPEFKLNRSTAGKQVIKFGIGDTANIGTIKVKTRLGVIDFWIVPQDTPFLLSLHDMDRLDCYYNNLKNILVQGHKNHPIVRKFGHPFLLLESLEFIAAYTSTAWSSIAVCHLTTQELRLLHRRHGHPSAWRLITLLRRAGQEFKAKDILHLTKYCHHCQLHSKSPGRFKFTLRDDADFNHCIYLDIVFLPDGPFLHVIDEGTGLQAGAWLKDQKAKTVWDALRYCWIDVYIGPPDIVAYDSGKNFASVEFRQNAKALNIITVQAPVEAHQSIGKVERAHAALRRAYAIITDELKSTDTSKEVRAQMALKAVNDSQGPKGYIPTLLAFGARPKMSEFDPPHPGMISRAQVIRQAMIEIRKINAERQVQDALRMTHSPSITWLHTLPLYSPILIYREKGGINHHGGWSGPYRFHGLENNGTTVLTEINGEQVRFRATVVKPYLTEEQDNEEIFQPSRDNNGNTEQDRDDYEDSDSTQEQETEQSPNREDIYAPPTAKRGRPKGSGKPKEPKIPKKRGRPRKIKISESLTIDIEDEVYEELEPEAFLSKKEQQDKELSKQLREQGMITTPGAPFEHSDDQEFQALRNKNVFEITDYDQQTMQDEIIFNSRFVREIKGKGTPKPYEKSRLVIQAHSDPGSSEVITAAPTVLRASWRLLLSFVAYLIYKKTGYQLRLRDITQAYVQSKSVLARVIYALPPKEYQHKFDSKKILKIVKPLYGVPEAGIHWWATYTKFFKEKLAMSNSTYDPCLLVSTTKKLFGLIGVQIDDTLILANTLFLKQEDEQLKAEGFTTKPPQDLSPSNSLPFNGGMITTDGQSITLKQKGQGNKLKQIDTKSTTFKDEYREQRARGAYIASVSQPEAAYDLSIAAQVQEPTEEDAKALNKRLQWQQENTDRGLTYPIIDFSKAKLYIFVDGSFANNKDFSSQLGYVIILGTEEYSEDRTEFVLYGSIIHWLSIKSRRVTKSALASEILAMSLGIDFSLSLSETIKLITTQLDLPDIPLILCTDSKSLYECIVKLGTTTEKRLMIDIMALREAYEKREIIEIRWIKGTDNPADHFTKAKPSKALQELIDKNELRIRVQGWVDR